MCAVRFPIFLTFLSFLQFQLSLLHAQVRPGDNPEPIYGNYALKTYTIADGLPSKNTTSCLKDKRGFIWVGTENGLCRFDGYTFKIFYHKEGDNASISNNYISTIVEDHSGRLWVGTMDGLNVLDTLTEKLQRFYNN